jgi:hypothetical protein
VRIEDADAVRDAEALRQRAASGPAATTFAIFSPNACARSSRYRRCRSSVPGIEADREQADLEVREELARGCTSSIDVLSRAVEAFCFSTTLQ